jgi:acyl-CoA thioesterase-2
MRVPIASSAVSDGSDLSWLGLERARTGGWTFVVAPALSRMDGKFYGGTGIAVATAVMEAETGRRAVWTSAQFVSSCATGERVRVDVNVGASGRRSSQVQVQGFVGGQLLFTAMGATGEVKATALERSFGQMPEVARPEDGRVWDPMVISDRFHGEPGWLGLAEIRHAGDTTGLWLRMKNRSLSRAAMAFLADVIPSGVMRAAGRLGAGTSLDNTLRFGPDPTGDWMLVDIDPQLISGGYLHGTARLWAQDGRLIGVASQSASVVLFDGAPPA